METLKITLPKAMKVFIEAQVAARGFRNAGDYLRDLIRQAQWRHVRDRIEALLLEGLEGEPIEVTSEFWQQQRREFEERQRKLRRTRKL